MVNRLVAVDENGNLPEGVKAQLVAPLRDEFTDLSEAASASAVDAENWALVATAAAEAAEISAGRVQKNAIGMSKLPVNASGLHSYNGSAHIQDNLTVFNGKQYAVWWSATLTPIVARRTLPDGPWTTFDLSTVAGNPLASPVLADGHNCMAVAVDSAGYIHVWGNHHNHPLRYVKSSAPESITSWVTGTMVGSQENLVTYPTPITSSDGTLYFMYRQGVLAGGGDWYLNKYNPTTATWTRFAWVSNGGVSSEVGYPNHVVPGPDGSLTIFFLWRSGGPPSTNNDMCYVKILPNGTAVKSTGATQVLPITHANAEVIFPTAPTGSGLLNQQGADIDSEGNPHAVNWMNDSNGNTQLWHIWRDSDGWHQEFATSFTQNQNLDVPYFEPLLSRAQVVCPEQGGTFLVYRCGYGGKGNVIRMIDVTPGRARVDFPILDLNLYDWEPNLDTQALKTRNELSMLCIPLLAHANNSTTWPYNTSAQWSNQVVLNVVIDLAQIDAFKAGSIVLPHLEQIADRNGPPAGVTITATSAADFTHGPVAMSVNVDQVTFAKFVVRATAGASTTTTLQIASNREKPVAQSSVLGITAITNETNSYLETPWLLNGDFTSRGQRGFVVLYAFKTGTGTSNVSAARLEIARLVGLTS